jgi:hypothetical protein
VSALLAAGAQVRGTSNYGRTALMDAAAMSQPDATEALLAHPRIHPCVDDALDVIGDFVDEDEEGDEEGDGAARTALVHEAFGRWRMRQAVCAAARAADVRGAACLPPTLVAALAAATEAGVSEDALSEARDVDGLTALGGAAAAGASMEVVMALVAAGCSVLVPGDLAGASVGALAARAGHRQAADWLYRAATKAAARAQPLFRDVRSMLVVGTSGVGEGRTFLPLDVLNHIMEHCAAPTTCWFSEPPVVAELELAD